MESSNKPKDFFKPPEGNLFVNATINFVDTKRNVCDAISQDGMRFLQNCQYLKINPDGSGEIQHPCVGDTCVVKVMADGSCLIDKIYTVTSVDADGVPNRDLGPYSKFMPGDKVWLAKGGAFLAILRRGLVKIGVTPLCQMVFMQLENYTRWISRNIEILSSGFRFYSVNTNGLNISRLSIFLKDAMSKELRDKSSESSDFEVVVKDSALTIMTGPKDSATGLRKNTSILTLVNDGSLILYQQDKTTGKMLQRIMYTPNGCSEHSIYDGENKTIYSKKITRNLTNEDPKVIVTEEVSGEYNLKVEGHVGITASKDVSINGKNVFSVAEQTHSTQCSAHLVDADIKG